MHIPLSILTDRTLSVLEILVEYLKEHEKLSFHEIAVLTNRDDRTIWTVYNRAKKKRLGKNINYSNEKKKDNIQIPLSVLTDRTLSVLEVMVEYLKEKEKLSFHEIAVLTNRDDRTIWTVYNRVKKKRAGGGKA